MNQLLAGKICGVTSNYALLTEYLDSGKNKANVGWYMATIRKHNKPGLWLQNHYYCAGHPLPATGIFVCRGALASTIRLLRCQPIAGKTAFGAQPPSCGLLAAAHLHRLTALLQRSNLQTHCLTTDMSTAEIIMNEKPHQQGLRCRATFWRALRTLAGKPAIKIACGEKK